MENTCMFLEPDEDGDICHADETEMCPGSTISCAAEYDIHGRPFDDSDTCCVNED